MKKRFLSGLLSLVLLFSLLPVKVYAADPPNTDTQADASSGTTRAGETDEPDYGGLEYLSTQWLSTNKGRFLRTGYIEMNRVDYILENSIAAANKESPNKFPDASELEIWFRSYASLDDPIPDLTPDSVINEENGWKLFEGSSAVCTYGRWADRILCAYTHKNSDTPNKPIAYGREPLGQVADMSARPSEEVTAVLQADGSVILTFKDSCNELYCKPSDDTLIDPYTDYQDNPTTWTKAELPEGIVSGTAYEVTVPNPENKTHMAFVQQGTAASGTGVTYKTHVIKILDPSLLTIDTLGWGRGNNRIYGNNNDKEQDKTQDYDVLAIAPADGPKPELGEDWRIDELTKDEIFEAWNLEEIPESDRFLIPADCENQYLVLLTVSPGPEQKIKRIQVTVNPITYNTGHIDVTIGMPGNKDFEPLKVKLLDYNAEIEQVMIGKDARSVTVTAQWTEETDDPISSLTCSTHIEGKEDVDILSGENGSWTLDLSATSKGDVISIRVLSVDSGSIGSGEVYDIDLIVDDPIIVSVKVGYQPETVLTDREIINLNPCN